jgi:hypothetical protein
MFFVVGSANSLLTLFYQCPLTGNHVKLQNSLSSQPQTFPALKRMELGLTFLNKSKIKFSKYHG